MQKLIAIGILFLFIGIILVFAGSLYATIKGDKEKGGVKSAAIVFIGPFPFGWASDKDMFYILLAIVIIFTILWLTFFRRF